MNDKNTQGADDDLLADLSDILGEEEAGSEVAPAAADASAQETESPSGMSDEELADLDAFLDSFGTEDEAASPVSGDEQATADVESEDEAAEAAEADETAEGQASVPEEEMDPAAPDELLDLAQEDTDPSLADELLDLGDETQEDAGAGPDETVALDEDLFDLSTGETEPAATEPEAEVAGIEELVLEEEVQPPPVQLDSANQAAATAKAADEGEAQTMAGNGKLTLVALVLAGLAILAGGAGAWFGYSQQGQITALGKQLAARPDQAAGADAKQFRQLQQELGQLNQRVNELALLMEGPMSHIRESNQRELESIFSRLDELDKSLSKLDQRLAAQAAKLAPAAAKPAAQSAKPSPQPAAKPASGQWVVNLASLTDAKSAEAELADLHKQGINASRQVVEMSGRTWYRLRVTGFASKAEAEAYGAGLKDKLGLKPWVARQ